ncbi:hypothetical protein [Alteriqipengyuania lutimaris]|uniref:Uncharacterized protein n=1 Tax=Alteriqipengyuania lutimaris TaxID=1538146 RepID=A0A395LG85_9SPHN|nr:hypothetical protein [Alteriqipengyuania lutimaris]MBB3035245.1 hypothetical protein [Alteriqipengyuania lutimaris]RDS75842.1 hypothetical protein DL238_14245 [Alteriqipengyuania lutimaris]
MKWLWIVLLALLAALVLWWLLADDDGEQAAGEPVAVEQGTDPEIADTTAAAGAMTIGAILANPEAFYGEEGFEGTVTVGGPLTDRGFWIENDGARMFALVIDDPIDRTIDINTGATLRLDGGTIREGSTIAADEIEGDGLDQDTMDVIADQDAVLVIDESNITIEDEA